MKKLFKRLPLLIVPMLLSSCIGRILPNIFPGNSSQSSSQTSESSSNTGSSSQGGSSSSSSSSSSGSSSSTSSSQTVAVTGVTLNQSSFTIKVGQTYTLQAKIAPANATNKKVTWSSNNAAVSVTSGTIRGESIGSGNLTVTTQDGNKTATCAVTVVSAETVINPTSITLDVESKTIEEGKTFTITPTVWPANADNKKVNWSTGNSCVSLSSAQTQSGTAVTVTANTIGSTLITAASPVDPSNIFITCQVEVTEKQVDKWTIMIYMCGADLESENGFATADINEILSVNGQPEDVNIIIETGGASSWKTSKIDASKLGRWYVENKQLKQDGEFLTYASMGLQTTFQSFLEWGLDNYPAEKTGVILWNHGGAMQGVCFDEKKSNDGLDASEVTNALGAAFVNCGLTGQKLEFIGYDACLMQVQDVAEKNSTYFNYMLASEESEAGEGWAYNSWLDDLYTYKPTTTILKAACDGFISAFDTNYPTNANDQTLSYLDLSKMSAYKTAFESLASSIGSCISSYGASNFRTWMKFNIKYFSAYFYTYADLQEIADYYSEKEGHDPGYYTPEDVIESWDLEKDPDTNIYWDFESAHPFAVFDVKDFLNSVGSLTGFSGLSSKITAAKNALSELVVYSAKGAEAGDAYGLSLFFPITSSASKSYYYTASETNFSNWRSVVNSYGA